MKASFLFQLFLGAIGALFLAFGIYLLSLFGGSDAWPGVESTIVRSEVVQTRESDGSYSYSAEVEHRYEVDGQIFTKKSALNHDAADKLAAERALVDYPEGGFMLIRVKPGSPDVFMQDNGPEAIIGTAFSAIGAVLLLLAVGIGFVARKLKAAPSAN